MEYVGRIFNNFCRIWFSVGNEDLAQPVKSTSIVDFCSRSRLSLLLPPPPLRRRRRRRGSLARSSSRRGPDFSFVLSLLFSCRLASRPSESFSKKKIY